jgi:hypothetical protein
VAEEQRLLGAFVKAAGELGALAGPFTVPEAGVIGDEWGFPIPLRWEIQLRYLWLSDADSFDVAAGVLSRRASAAALAPIRLLWENYVLVRWLVAPGGERRARSLNFALSEILDLRRQVSGLADQSARQELVELTERMESELKKRAASEGLTLTGRPSNADLRKTYGGSPFAYNTLSDIGVHAGLAAPLVFFQLPGQTTMRVNFATGGILHRAYYLGMAFELHAVTAFNIAQALGWADLHPRLSDVHESQKDNLTIVSRLLNERSQAARSRSSGRTVPEP